MKDVIYGGITALMDRRENFYKSSIGAEYCHWTDTGKEALQAFIEIMSSQIHKTEENELDRRAKELVLKELKETPK
jgi:2-oxoglutarate dehydrogenase complex dehydrogenase (E1) component-like enzyme